MTPHEFLTKWRHVELKERSASQSHFNDLCALLGVVDPVSADPTGEWFTFDKGAAKTSGGDGWADVWRRGCFAWEYKGRHANLDSAYRQLQQYAVALENPPLLIVSDMDRIVIRTNWTNSVQEAHEFALDDLIDGAVRDRIKAAFTDPERFRPKKSRQELTEETAGEFAGLAQRLRDRGHEPHRVAHFVNQLVFCMFAEDVGLLPDSLFSKMLEVSRRNPAEFAENARTLFGAMARQGGKVGFTQIEWFNGGLFADDSVLPVSDEDVDQLLKAAGRDWSQIDPSILGTLFERGLDPAKRSQLGAHYTDRDKIMMIVRPVVIEPLEAEWAGALEKMKALVASAPQRTAERLLTPAERRKAERVKAEAAAIHSAFVERLANFRVLDPACGSGNFLYVALRSLKDLEHRANLDAEALGLPRGFPRVGPECVLGIELNPYAAELARVSVWIGEIQWMRRNGFDAAKNPILRPLETIECRDAVLNADGTRAEWPEADAVVGNPPFLGNKKMLAELGEEYTVALRKAWPEVPGGVDLVCYWFAKAWAMIASGGAQRAGFVATNSIRSGNNREVLRPIVEHGRIFEAWSDQEWTVDGAAVRVSLVSFDLTPLTRATLDGLPVGKVFADLSVERGGVDLTSATRLSENRGVGFQGPVKVGAFDVEGDVARRWLSMPVNPNGRPNSDVVRPLLNGQDITQRASGRWIIDFGVASEVESAVYEAPFEHVRAVVKPFRDANRRERRRLFWWQHGETVPGIKKAARGLQRAIFTPRVAKYRLFVWASPTVVPDSRVVIVCRDDDTTFGILHSKLHEAWSLALGGWHGVGNDPQYTPSLGFETFPFPEGLTPDIPAADYADDPRAQAIAAAAARLNELRENWLNPADLVVRVPEVVAGYPDRILPKDEDAAKELKKRTLTNLYNARPQWLANAHAALDAAVADAYGWGEDWRAGRLDEDEILARLFRLNQQRAGKITK
ncbi:class I SAM-dependent DNA methyltransferase [Sphingomonas canadensis]|uniref:site-specific DNA-methyltransferase (adenine-specific) n=1 Tax=Sphingomonas canadensis TaxID=1219257 RepID=A0ABW3H2I4_9SPHN|nr:class I SAM-dependent DNA methyltransferase [Sphingomonas canadensis]MCW3834512.1 class I SAM-dependent DNA methyltransferase [Sphingomonas canadensis]